MSSACGGPTQTTPEAQPGSALHWDATKEKCHCDFQKQLEKLMDENHSRKAAVGKIPAASGSPRSLQGSTLALVYAPFQHRWCLGRGQSRWPGQTHSCSLSGRAGDVTLLLSGIIAQHRAAQRAARETPAPRLRGSALNASQNELFKHPTSSSDPTRATQNTFLPCGSTPGGCSDFLVPVARCQPVPSPPPADSGVVVVKKSPPRQ